MLILLIAIALLLINFSSFTLAYQILTLNRVISNTPISIVETSIIQNTDLEEANHLFSRYEFERRINDYYDFELKKFSGKYSLDFYYFNQEDLSICMYDDCPAVWLKVSADLLYDYHYERNLVFRVMYHFYEL